MFKKFDHFIITFLFIGFIQTACTGAFSTSNRRTIPPKDLKLILTNTPLEVSSLLNVDITLSGDGIANYRYKLGRAEDIDCKSSEAYSKAVNIKNPIATSLASLPDGEMRLCVYASNANDQWQSLTQVTEVNWTKDTVAPVITMKFPNRDGLSLGYKAKVEGTCTLNDGTTQIKFASGAKEVTQSFDCTTGSFNRYVDVSSLEVGNISFELTQTDAAGNTHLISRSLHKHTSLCDTLSLRQRTSADGFAGGAGVLNDPYLLCTTDQLNQVRNTTDKYFRLGNDLYFEAGDTNGDFVNDLSDTDYTSGDGWLPIPTAIEYLEGENHTISGFRINRPSTDDVGLFSSVAWATIEDLQIIDAQVTGQNQVGVLLGSSSPSPFHFFRISLIDSSVTGSDDVGGIVGDSGGGIIHSSQAINHTVTGQNRVGGLVGHARLFIQSSKVQGSISGAGDVGGLVGYRGTIYNSSVNVNVTGTGNQVGGIAGRFAEIYQSYARGQISSTGTHVGCLMGGYAMPVPRDSFAACESVTGDSQVGYINGQNLNLVNSYYSSSMNCTQTGGGSCATNVSTASALTSFYDASHPLYASWDFRSDSTDGRSELWVTNSSDLPSHFFEIPYEYSPSLSGQGTEASPYLISSTNDLLEVSSNPFYQKAHLRMTQNIDLSTAPAGSFKGLFKNLPFEGSFDGGGFRVFNLSISEPSDTGHIVGFFGSVMGQAQLRNFHVEVASLSGGRLVGAVAGYVHTKKTFESLGSSGAAIQADSSGGGLIGSFVGRLRYAESHNNIQCLNDGCGGLIGSLNNGFVSDSFATGDVSGVGTLGGLVGHNGGGSSFSSQRAYATGDVSGSDFRVGGLVGGNYAPTSYSFALGNVSSADATNAVGFVFGHGTATPNYYLNTSTCTNSSGSCNLTGTGVGVISYFYDKTNPPLDNWDFDNIWQENMGALPTLRDMP